MNAGFGIFIQDEKGPLWKDECSDLAEAKRRAERLSKTCECDVFIFCLTTYREVARIKPHRHTKIRKVNGPDGASSR